MSTQFDRELNKYFEMIGLLYGCTHPDFMTNERIEEAASDFNINPDELGKAQIVVKKYLSAFQKKMVKESIEDFDFFFSDDDDDFIFSLQFVCASHSEWFEKSLHDIAPETISLAFINDILTETQTFTSIPAFDEMISLLNQTGFSSNTCWKLMLILQSPREKIDKLSQIIHGNLAAYEKALAAIQKPLNRLLANFPDGKFFCDSLHQDSKLTPTLIYPIAELVNTSRSPSISYVGLFINDVYKMQLKAKASQQNTLPLLKALSDKSKFEILLSLMKAPKYNLELANELNLSAATISHHMNVLLTCQLVNVEKKDGRVYYTISKETIENLLSELRNKFLC